MKIEKILIVEDSIISRNLLIHSIPDAEKYSIRDAEDGQKAWYEVQRFQPDFIILDINMPNVNGWTFLEQIRSENIMTPVIVVTTEIILEEKLKRLGVLAYIKKPIHKNHMHKIFEKLAHYENSAPLG
jgi:CheY-like chemotaxis protein